MIRPYNVMKKKSSSPAYTYYDITYPTSAGDTVHRSINNVSSRDTGLPPSAAGDLLVYVSLINVGGLTLTSPSGWTTMVGLATDVDASLLCSYKVSSGSEPASATWTWGTNASGSLLTYTFKKSGGIWVAPDTEGFLTSKIGTKSASPENWITNSIDIPGKCCLYCPFLEIIPNINLNTPPSGMTGDASGSGGNNWNVLTSGANGGWNQTYEAAATGITKTLIVEGTNNPKYAALAMVIAARD